MNIKNVAIHVEGTSLQATIFKPDAAKGILIFVHGLGSGRFSPRNVRIANQLQNSGFATVLCNLDTEKESHFYKNHFDLHETANRLGSIVLWLKSRRIYEKLPLAFMGSGMGPPGQLKPQRNWMALLKRWFAGVGISNLSTINFPM